MVDERIVTNRNATDLTNMESNEEKDSEISKRQLQNEMDSARESISQTVNAIADTVTHQAQAVRDTIASKLDWREHARNHPAAVIVGTATAGFIFGYGFMRMGGKPQTKRNETEINSKPNEETEEERPTLPLNVHKKEVPGFFSRLKTTRGYQRLSDGANDLLDQFVNETINVGKTVLLPIAVDRIAETIRTKFEDKSADNIGKKEIRQNQSSPVETKQTAG